MQFNSKYVLATVQGGSMYPLMNSGDIVIAGKDLPYGKGSVILYEVNNIITCHRIFRLKDTIETKGDNLPWLDADQILHEKVLGVVRYVFKVKDSKYLLINNSKKINIYNNIEIRLGKFLGCLFPHYRAGKLAKTILKPVYYTLIYPNGGS